MTDTYQLAVMRSVLKKWGAICELSRNWNGYPNSDTTYRAAYGRGGEKRLPIANIPSFAIQMSREVMRLPDELGNAVTLWYAHHFNAAGVWLEPEDKAKILGVCERTLRQREREGREMLVTKAPQIIDRWQEWVDARDGREADPTDCQKPLARFATTI